MKQITINFEENKVVEFHSSGDSTTYSIDTSEGFDLISKAYLRAGWDNKYVYSFTWMGRPIIQLPDDVMRIQELIYMIQPDVLIEIGVAHGGSLIFYASLMEAMGKGRVVGVDLEIRAHNRLEIERHRMFSRIDLIEGDSINKNTVDDVRSRIHSGDKVMVLLDGNHSYKHVLAELEIYGELVSKDSYILAMDGIQRDLVGAPRSSEDWSWNNAANAAEDFVKANKNFILDYPAPLFNEGKVTNPVTYWPSAYVKKIA